MTTLLLRADAGPSIGVGHLSRCVAFAEAATARGWRVVLSGAVVAGQWLTDLPLLPAAQDANSLAAQAQEAGAQVVLVDHYGMAADLWHPLRRAGAVLVSMEDGGYGRRPADVVVDSGFAKEFRPADGSAVVLTGPLYAPLRAVVRQAREHRARARPGGVPRVVVVLGGGDTGAVMPAVLGSLRNTGLAMDVLAISASPVAAPSAGAGQRFTISGPRADLLTLAAEADLVVSAAGVTLLELCCVGVPIALVRLTDNQSAGYRVVVEGNLVVGLGAADALVADQGPATDALRDLLTDPARLATLATATSGLVDGLGAGRVLDRAVRQKATALSG